ncbi:MAG: hypothetical protein WCG85_23080 [Polyangia bacterium]
MTLADLERRLDAIARRVSRPRNPATLTTSEMRARLADLLGMSEGGLAELASECRAAGISMSDYIRANCA